MVSIASNVRPNIVDTSFTMDEMVKLFANKGLSVLDVVILSGSYAKLRSISRCISILFTLYNLLRFVGLSIVFSSKIT
jgi:hypothetical protein